MRGKVSPSSSLFLFIGITPAHAGKSTIIRRDASRIRDHPRTCGEKSGGSPIQSRHSGSPPHMRGKVLYACALAVMDGITPAHAGKSSIFGSSFLCSWDHPRTCGEKFHIRQVGHDRKGSPPHMRGKVTRRMVQCTCPGITPAHAGKRQTGACLAVRFWDHPRTCGEKYEWLYDKRGNKGSPPHMRGKVPTGNRAD